jgi:ribose transport system substrate-binding protein
MHIIKSIVITSVSLALVACAGTGIASASNSTKNPGAKVLAGATTSISVTVLPKSCHSKHPVIAVDLPDTSNPYYVAMRQGFLAQGAHYGFDVKVSIADDDQSTALAQIDAFIQENVCALGISTINSTTSVAQVVAMNKAGIPVFTVNDLLDPTDLAAEHAHVVDFVGANQCEGGTVEGKQVLKDFGAKARIFAGIVGFPTSSTNNLRDHCFGLALKSDPNAKVGPTVNGGTEPTIALTATTDMLEGNPTMNVIWADSGPNALGAFKAVESLKSRTGVSVFGFCAADTRLTNIYRGCVGQQPYYYAEVLVNQMARYLDGRSIPTTILEQVPTYVTGQLPASNILG